MEFLQRIYEVIDKRVSLCIYNCFLNHMLKYCTTVGNHVDTRREIRKAD